MSPQLRINTVLKLPKVRPPAQISKFSATGFSLIELIITFLVVGILAGTGYANFATRWQNERLLSSSRILVSWLEERRRQGMVSLEQMGTGACSIKVDITNATFSATDATIRPSSGGETNPPPNICRNPAPLQLRAAVSNTNNLNLSVVPSSLGQVLFSFRGTSPTEAEFKLQLADYRDARCVRITSPLGLIRQGIARPASAPCKYISAY